MNIALNTILQKAIEKHDEKVRAQREKVAIEQDELNRLLLIGEALKLLEDSVLDDILEIHKLDAIDGLASATEGDNLVAVQSAHLTEAQKEQMYNEVVSRLRDLILAALDFYDRFISKRRLWSKMVQLEPRLIMFPKIKHNLINYLRALMKDGKIVYKVKDKRNDWTFWGRKEWIGLDGEPMQVHMYSTTEVNEPQD